MARNFLLTILFFVFAASAFAQSGRNKSKESPTPTPSPRPNTVYSPTGIFSYPKPTPLPAPPPIAIEDDGEIFVESALVPIPVSVTDFQGQAVTDLKLEDFILQIDGQKAEIGDLARSQTPVRLVLLFDNSSSVLIAREFEKKAAIKFFKKVIRPEKDLVALFSVATYTRLEQPFTKNVSQLTSAIERFPLPEGATSLLDGVIKAA
jgi:hypothetical protein